MQMQKLCNIFLIGLLLCTVIALPISATNNTDTTEAATVEDSADTKEETPEVAEGTGTVSSEYSDSSMDMPDSTATSTLPETTEEPVLVSFVPEGDSKAGVLKVKKTENGWEVVQPEFYEEGTFPQTVVISPEYGDKHANIILEQKEGTWEAVEEHYYGTKLQVLPILVVLFVIVLALVVLCNLLLIKIYRR